MKMNYRVTVPIAALIAAAVNPVSAQEANLQSLISPNERSVEIGVMGIFDSNITTGKFSNLSETPGLPIFNGTWIDRNEATGEWIRGFLDLGNRDLNLEYEKQGDFKYFLDFSQIHKSNPLNIVTGLTGTDDNLQTVNGVSPRELDLETDRYIGKLGMSQTLSKDLDVQMSYRVDRKEGGRPIAFGTAAVTFAVDPIDQSVHEVDAKVNYKRDQLQLTGGFLGSFFDNNNDVVIQTNGSSKIALPPSNQAYNVYLNGGYNFTPTTRADFKLSETLHIQAADFFTTSTNVGAANDLGGEVQNHLAMASINSRVDSDLTLRGKVRYESRYDNTPIKQYINPSTAGTGRNYQYDRDTITTEGEATYRLPDDYSLTGGIKYEYWDRAVPVLRQSNWRTRTDEYSGRAQVNKMMTESLGGSLAYIYSTRTGNAYNRSVNTPPEQDFIDPILWGDRERNQARMTLSWTPTTDWSVQAMADGSLDTYHDGELPLGPEEGNSYNASLDATYQLTRDWDINGFVSRNVITREQKTVDQDGGLRGLWRSDLKNGGYAGGLSLGGKPSDDFKVRAEAQYSYDKSEYNLRGQDGHQNVRNLPDIVYRQLDLKLTGEYALSSNQTVKLGYVFTHMENSDFTYDVNVYTDRTIIKLPGTENSHFVGISYIQRW